MDIAKILSVERARHGMSIDEMCRLIGVTRSTYYYWERKNFENVDSQYIIKLATLFKTSTDYILGLETQGLPCCNKS